MIEITEERRGEACPRCNGRMFPEGPDGDRACFNCGHTIYKAPPLGLPNEKVRRPSHGGKSLW
jgi:hypothetical protein